MNKRALLLLNMGGPNNLDEVELFLRNMFSDKYILPINPLMRKMVGTIIIKKRLKEVKENFSEYLGGKSPLSGLTQELIDKLQTQLDMPIFMAMRYVPPFALDALKVAQAQGIEELILFPMYPQCSTTTTISSVEEIQEHLKTMGYEPKLKVMCNYYDDNRYIKASFAQIVEALGQRNASEYDLIVSAHGLPVSIARSGDVYEKQIEANFSALKLYLELQGVHFRDMKLVYQSKVGGGRWLEPALDTTIRNPKNLKVLIYPIAFTIDNSETLFELDIETREIADKIGYDDFVVAKCFNASEAFANFIAQRIEESEAKICVDCIVR
ncbi:MAG: ferrochelatase [Campylobacterales bacterium]|nr:ferrochelatase [Campylobacterales bacterium]